jgi:hypothetical protein
MISPDKPAIDQPRAGRELVILPARERARPRWLRNLAIVGFFLLAAGTLGWAAGSHLARSSSPDPVVAAAEKAESQRLAQEATTARRQEAQRLEAERQEMRQLAEEVRALKDGLGSLQASLGHSRQADEAKALKASVEALKASLDAAKSDTAGAIGQLSGKLDKVDQGTAQKLVKIAERLDQLERRPDPMPTGSIAPPRAAAPAAPPPSAPQPPAKPAELAAAPPAPQPPKQPIPGFVLRDVYQGIALVEGHGGYREVQVGEGIPGAGKVESIERRGRRWVVVTTQGLITQTD